MSENQPVVSVDPVPFIYTGDELKVVLCQRKWAPEEGAWALPGVMLPGGLTVEKAARVGIRAKLGVSTSDVRQQYAGDYVDESNRDPRGATISLTQIMVMAPDSMFLQPVSFVGLEDDLSGLPFAHGTIIRRAYERHTEILNKEPQRAADLLEDQFTSTDLREVLEAFGHPMPSASILRLGRAHFDEVGRVAEGRGKPTVLWQRRTPRA